ncbi:MAG TPA: hypothetical protein VEQ18_02530, partial [Candidatus Nitrosocosmicus sp.]|nr:hypothetical protein [Candidatus Nitrosocosmicus sp.]
SNVCTRLFMLIGQTFIMTENVKVIAMHNPIIKRGKNFMLQAVGMLLDIVRLCKNLLLPF